MRDVEEVLVPYGPGLYEVTYPMPGKPSDINICRYALDFQVYDPAATEAAARVLSYSNGSTWLAVTLAKVEEDMHAELGLARSEIRRKKVEADDRVMYQKELRQYDFWNFWTFGQYARRVDPPRKPIVLGPYRRVPESVIYQTNSIFTVWNGLSTLYIHGLIDIVRFGDELILFPAPFLVELVLKSGKL